MVHTATTRPLARPMPAAVIEANAPGADAAARVVPPGARKFFSGKSGTSGATMGYVTKPARPSRFNAVTARAAVRLRELARLASWRARWGVVSDVAGWAAVCADALAELDGIGEWRADAQGVAAQMPPGVADAEAVAAALSAPRRPGRLFSNREAGRLVELVRLEADDPDLCGPITTLTARDIDDAELAQRRLTRRREGARERKRRARAKCVTPQNVTFQPPANVTFAGHASRRVLQRDILAVTNHTPGQAIAPASVAAALAIKPGAARARLLRWLKAGVIQQAGRGHYLVVGHAGGPAAPPQPPAPGRLIAMPSGTEAAQASDAVGVPPCG